jgi:hypothetical protein
VSGLHYVRDVTFAEDASQTRIGTGTLAWKATREAMTA